MNGCDSENCDQLKSTSRNRRKSVCVIGAGTAGLCALKHSLQHHGMTATCYEQSNELGGTWVYNDQLTDAENAQAEVHSSMYEGLRTNLPKEVMGYPDYPYPNSLSESFIASDQVLAFLQSYAQHFQLHDHIKFQHSVIRVRPCSNGQWEVYVRDIAADRYHVVYYDFVFVCNGHYTTPQCPDIKGMDVFRGRQMHSHLYRKASMFHGEKVLIIGAGPSGMDLAHHISRTADRVYLSHHLDPAPDTAFMRNVTQKPDVERFTENGALFRDGSTATFTVVLYCTGYKYSFPFLSCDCGLMVRDNGVYPMYKHCININQPTMAVIGLPYLVLPTQCFDLQIRFALKYFSGQRQLPTKQQMMEDLENELAERKAKGLTQRQVHQMGERQFDYYRDLCELAGIEPLRPVIQNIMIDCKRKYIYELETYRNNVYKILNDEEFVKIPYK